MFIPQKYTDIALKKADAIRKEQKVTFDERSLENYKEELRKIAKKRSITEGSDLTHEETVKVNADIIYLMLNATSRVATMDATDKRKVKANEYILSAFKYLIAVAESELGSPNLSLESFTPHFDLWAKNVVSANPITTDIDLEDTFKKQRRIDAKNLKEDIFGPLLNDINDKKNVSENVGKLYAEYRALVLRQKNHTGFWRFFHSAENAERTELIKDLEDVLKKYAPDIDLNAKTPVGARNVIRSAAVEQVVKGVKDGIELYNSDLPKAFGYSEGEIDSGNIQNEQSVNDKSNIIAQSTELIIEDRAEKKEENAIKENASAEGSKEGSEDKSLIDGAEDKSSKEEVVADKNIKESNVKNTEKTNAKPKIISPIEELKKIDNYGFRKDLEDELWDTVKDDMSYSVNKVSVIPWVVSRMINASLSFTARYDNAKKSGQSTEILNGIIHDAIKGIYTEAHKCLVSCNQGAVQRIISTQKICDVVLNKATVIGLGGAEYSKFASNYALAEGSIVSFALSETSSMLGKETIDFYIQKARSIAGVKAIEAQDNAVDSRGEEIEQGSKSVESDVQKNEPLKEKIVVGAVLDKEGTTEVSQRVNTHRSPTLSKSKD